MVLFVIFLNFLRRNLPKFSQHIACAGIEVVQLVEFAKAVFSFFANLCLLPLRKIGSYRFP